MKNKVFIFIFLIIILLGVGFFYKKNNVIKPSGSEKNTSNGFKYYYYSEDIVPEDDMEENSFNVYKILYLFDNNTYFYKYAEYGDLCGIVSKGNYTIDDGVLTLNETIRGNCDNCYFTKELDIYKFRYGENSLISSDEEELVKGNVEEVNGEVDFDVTYSNCNNLLD